MLVFGETLEKGSRYDLANSWSTALQGNPTANNHVICTVETRLMQALWKKVKRPDDSRQFSEAWLRTPTFFWGMVSVFAGALLGRRVGGWACGLAFALLLAVHPLHIRFSTEARGYASLLAGILPTQNLASGSGILSWYYFPMLPALLLVCASGIALRGRIISWVPGGAFILWGHGLVPSWQATV